MFSLTMKKITIVTANEDEQTIYVRNPESTSYNNDKLFIGSVNFEGNPLPMSNPSSFVFVNRAALPDTICVEKTYTLKFTPEIQSEIRCEPLSNAIKSMKHAKEIFNVAYACKDNEIGHQTCHEFETELYKLSGLAEDYYIGQ